MCPNCRGKEMTVKKSAKRVFGLISVALTASILMQWLIIPKIQWNNNVIADGDWRPSQSDSSGLINYSTILGGAVDYGIVADTLLQKAHSETTFAVNYYGSQSNNDVDYVIDKTAHFIIGVGFTNQEGYHPYIQLGKTRASTLYFEAPEDAFGTNFPARPYEGTNTETFQFVDGYGDADNAPRFIQAVNADASNNVNRLINRISSDTGRSSFLNERAAVDGGYVLNPNGDNCAYFGGSGGAGTNIDYDNYYGIYLNDRSFADKVVYIHVTDQMLYSLGRHALQIHKLPSTVVVFNFPETTGDVNLDCPFLTVYKEDSPNEVLVSAFTARTGENGSDVVVDEEGNILSLTDHAAAVQQYFNQGLIWNIMTNDTVNLSQMGGVVLCPAAQEVNLRNQSSGWIVAKHKVVTYDEMHFLYNNGSHDSIGQMHFELNKGFTYTYASESESVWIDSVDFQAGDFLFTWQEYADPDFTQRIGSMVPRSVNADSSVVLPSQTFSDPSDSHYVAPGAPSRIFYYEITEDPNHTIEGVSVSGGHVRIALKVTCSDTGAYTYQVRAEMTTGADGSIPFKIHGDTIKSESDIWVAMSGIRFDLGTFFNQLDTPTEGSLTINKTVEGCTLTSDETYHFNVYSEEGGVKTYYDVNGDTSTTPCDIPVTVAAGKQSGSFLIEHLSLGKTYTVVEINASAVVIDGYTLLDETHQATGRLTTDVPNAVANISNTYVRSDRGSIVITKNVAGNYSEASTRDYIVHVYSLNEWANPVTRTYYDLNGNSYYDTVQDITIRANQRLVVQNLDPNMTYYVEEVDASVPEYDLTVEYNGVESSNSQVRFDPSNIAPATVNILNTYTSTTDTYGYIKVVKTLSGVTLDLVGDINFTVSGVDGSCRRHQFHSKRS